MESDWVTLSYFPSSQETGFEISILKKYDIELLIGQMSYKQRIDIYNIEKGYDTTKNALPLKRQRFLANLQYIGMYVHMLILYITKLLKLRILIK